MLPNAIKDDEFADFLKNIRTFKAWVRKNKSRLGITVPETDERYYWALFEALRRHGANKDNLSIVKRYAGGLEKVFTRLNRLQSWVYNSWVGKVIAPAAYIKKILADLISTAVTKLVSLGMSAISGGALAPVMAVIEPLIRFVTEVVLTQVIEMATVMYKAIVHADIDSVFKYIDKTVERGAKIAMIVIGAFAMMIIIPGDNFMGAMATTFSPVDNTLTIGIGDAYGPNFQNGPGYILEPFSTKRAISGCFIFEDRGGVIPAMGPLSAWPSFAQDEVDRGIAALENTSGGYMARLCKKGDIKLWWSTVEANDGYCGYMYDSNTIVFGHNKYCWGSQSTYPIEWKEHLFAHETGHVYEERVGIESLTIGTVDYSFANAQAEDSGPFNTYPNQCERTLSESEDFAETIGNWVRIDAEHCWTPEDTGDCSSEHNTDTFWGLYSGHCDYADKVLTRDYQATPPTGP